MALDDDTSAARLRGKERRHFALKGLPHQVDTARLDAALRNVDRETREALVELVRGQQGNFDHLTSEIGRFAKLLNEGEADSADLRDRLDPHDHDESLMKNPARNEHLATGTAFYQSYRFGEMVPDEYVIEEEIYAVPLQVGENVYIEEMNAHTVDVFTSNGLTVTAGIYNGDGPGGLPGSLLVDGGSQSYTSSGEDVTWPVVADLRRGMWYWLAYAGDGAGSLGPTWWQGYSTTSSEGEGNRDYSHWWPFPQTGPSRANGILSYKVTPAGGWTGATALPEYLESTDFVPSSQGLGLEVSVP